MIRKAHHFSDLAGDYSIYKFGYEKFTLSAFCDGYIYQRPLREYEGVTPIKDFVNQLNLAARAQSDEPQFRHSRAEEINRQIATEADVGKLLASVQ